MLRFEQSTRTSPDGSLCTEVYCIYPDGSRIFKAFWNALATDEDYINRWKFTLISDWNTSATWPRSLRVERSSYPND